MRLPIKRGWRMLRRHTRSKFLSKCDSHTLEPYLGADRWRECFAQDSVSMPQFQEIPSAPTETHPRVPFLCRK